MVPRARIERLPSPRPAAQRPVHQAKVLASHQEGSESTAPTTWRIRPEASWLGAASCVAHAPASFMSLGLGSSMERQRTGVLRNAATCGGMIQRLGG
jgi:hypothetical protein